jgi:NitT/TauT family transport system substrate-binding protein
VRKILMAGLAAATLLADPARAAEPMPVTFVQSHPAFVIGEEVFIYVVPKLMGYYKAAGLDVTIQNALTGVQAVQVLMSGRAQFATGGVDGLLKTREQGGNPFAFAAIKQNNGWLMGVLPDSPIKTLADVKGRTIGTIALGSGGHLIAELEFGAMGLKDSDYNMLATGVGPAAAAALTNHRVDGLILYDSLFAAMENNGIKFRYIDLPTAGGLAGQIIATREDFASQHPDAVVGMCRSIAQGLHFTKTNPAAAVELFYKEWPGNLPTDRPYDQAIREGVNAMKLYLHYSQEGVPEGANTGAIPPSKWAASEAFYKSSGIIQGTSKLEDAYSNKYLDRCNDFDHAAVARQATEYKR